MIEIIYDQQTYAYPEFNQVSLSLLENLLQGQEDFTLKIKEAQAEIIEALQETCQRLNIQLEIKESSDPTAMVEIIKVLGSSAIGGAQGSGFGFVFAKALDAIKEQMGGEKALEFFLEEMLGIEIFIPSLGTILLATAITNALISGVTARLLLRKVSVQVNFLESQDNTYQGLGLEFRGN